MGLSAGGTLHSRVVAGPGTWSLRLATMSLICVADIEGSNGGETQSSDVFEGSGSNGEHEEHEERGAGGGSGVGVGKEWMPMPIANGSRALAGGEACDAA